MKKKAKKTNVGKSMIRAAKQALAFAKGEADITKYRVHKRQRG